MKTNPYSAGATLLLALALAPSAAWSAEKSGGFVSVTPAQLKWTDAPGVGPGAMIAMIEGNLKEPGPLTFRLKLPPNTKLPTHTHPLIEHVTVMSGTLYFAIGDKYDTTKAKAYSTGSALVIPTGMPMFAFTKDKESVLQLHGIGPWGITYLNPEEAPGKKK